MYAPNSTFSNLAIPSALVVCSATNLSPWYRYYINAKYYPVSIKENGKVVVQYIVNKPVEFRLKVTKVDKFVLT